MVGKHGREVAICGRYSLTKRKLDVIMFLHCKIDVKFTIMQEINENLHVDVRFVTIRMAACMKMN